MRRSFLVELKRRNVLRASMLYVGAAWALSQGVSQLGPLFGMPAWGTRWFIIACALGFPLWALFTWYFEFTPQGFRRDDAIPDDAPVRDSNARTLDRAIIGVLIVAVALLASGYFVHRVAPDTAGARGAPAKSIAVLPFENLSNDKGNGYFVAGMQDLILTKLAAIGDLKVIARSSTARYASRPADLRAVGRELGVATILEGSVQKVGNQVLINVQLIDPQTDAHIWAEAYTRDLDNIFGVEGDVAEKVAAALRTRLSREEMTRLAMVPTTNRAAYDLYLRAEHQAHLASTSYDTAILKTAIGLYRRAVERDPAFALARARLSSEESALAWFGGGGEDIEALKRQARADAERALQLAPLLAASHVALGYSDYYGRADYEAALKSFDAALALSPSDASALAARGYVERRQGRFDAAVASLQQALVHDPRNSQLTYEVGGSFMMVSRFVDAENWFRSALQMDPDNLNARTSFAKSIVLHSGDTARALDVVQGDAPPLRATRAWLLTLQRRYREAIALQEGIPDTPDNFAEKGGPKVLALAQLYTLAGDAETARPLFRQALSGMRTQLPNLQGMARRSALTGIAIAEAGLGHTDAALDAVADSNAVIAEIGDKVYGPEMLLANAVAYARMGRADLSLPLLARALDMPGIGLDYSPLMLWIDPSWDPIRGDPGFQALLAKHARSKPRATPGAAPALTAA